MGQSDWQICNLSDCPQWLEVAADWHLEEWLRTCRQVNLEEHEVQAAGEERRDHLRAHLTPTPLPTTFIVLTDAQQPIASLSLINYRRIPLFRTSAWLTNLYVVPRWRNRGIASGLLEYGRQYAQAQNVDRLYLYTFDRRAFYERRGWQCIGASELRGLPIDILSRAVA